MDRVMVGCPQERSEDSLLGINKSAASYVFIHTCV